MAIEIERKFLVKGEFKSLAKEQLLIKQGYLSSVPERIVRVRIKGNRAFLTVKGVGNASGLSRFEWEVEIPIPEAEQMLQLCEANLIHKTRFLIEFENHTFEVDEFYGENEGLILAELELGFEEEEFEKPDWLGVEVTNDLKYQNSMLLKNPFKKW